ncbi:hypothetical protein [Bacillus paranthracis]|uniref:hypothetical protein n=1 Tax=Bacillus paranthracis TaxID=2026186 RepID=UPI002D77F6C3|nr:hypothetical protein [Bacillus paranthracis]
MGERKEKVFHHLYGFIEIKRQGEIEVHQLFASEEALEAEEKRLEVKYGRSPNLLNFDLHRDTYSLQDLFGLFTVNQICEVDKGFKTFIESNLDLLSLEEY